ncbi:hypothetical protein WKI65_39325 [Streptomyces sp. MS1.AVA.3]|uniref:hypothetical protein n=1 Tax=Streptomyces decoyicus TaxID=249567 RepID=UPI0030BF5F89
MAAPDPFPDAAADGQSPHHGPADQSPRHPDRRPGAARHMPVTAPPLDAIGPGTPPRGHARIRPPTIRFAARTAPWPDPTTRTHRHPVTTPGSSPRTPIETRHTRET